MYFCFPLPFPRKLSPQGSILSVTFKYFLCKVAKTIAFVLRTRFALIIETADVNKYLHGYTCCLAETRSKTRAHDFDTKADEIQSDVRQLKRLILIKSKLIFNSGKKLVSEIKNHVNQIANPEMI